MLCEKFKNLEKIKLSLAKLEKIDERSFKNCVNLTNLDLEHNSISIIRENAFVNNAELKFLILNDNKIVDKLPENVFARQSKLEELHLRFNKLEEFPTGIFKNLHNLEVLKLTNNRMSKLNPELLENLTMLKTLSLGNNELDDLPPNVFTPLKNLEVLKVYGNKLTTINSDSFGEHLNLSELIFSSNKINAIDEKLFDKTGIKSISGRMNICFDGNDSSKKIAITTKESLQKCFENYQGRFATTTEENEESREYQESEESEVEHTFFRVKPYIMKKKHAVVKEARKCVKVETLKEILQIIKALRAENLEMNRKIGYFAIKINLNEEANEVLL